MNKEKIATILADYWKERGMPQYDYEWALEYIKEGHHKEFEHEFHEVRGSVYSLVKDVSGLVEIRDAVGDHDEIIQDVLKNKFRKTIALVFEDQKEQYEKHGFEEEGKLKDHFKKGETLFIMSHNE